MNDEDISRALFLRLPEKQVNAVFNSEVCCDIEPSFMGFVVIYKALSEIIPKHFTVVDLGCAFAPQSYYFERHTAYVGVDTGAGPRFHANNTTHYCGTIQNYIANDLDDITGPKFAICSYVPNWYGLNKEVIKSAFDNLFMFYPERDPDG